MNEKLHTYNTIFSSFPGVKITQDFVQTGNCIKGHIEMTVLAATLPFDIEIPLGYPLGIANYSIRFYCRSITGYKHQNLDQSICLHPAPDENLEQKLRSELQLLGRWIEDYYINDKEDEHYEYLLIPDQEKVNMLFDGDVKVPSKGSFGFFDYFSMGSTPFVPYRRLLALSIGDQKAGWSRPLMDFNSAHKGIWVYIEKEPVLQRRQVVYNWAHFQRYISEPALRFIYEKARDLPKLADYKDHIPLMVGYKIPSEGVPEAHWELILLPVNPLPIEFLVEEKHFVCKLKNEAVSWGRTSNCSYDRFFGRGKLDDAITESEILVIGTGAIGSSLINHLIRGGARKITVTDFDFVESGNICRSEYTLRQIGLDKRVGIAETAVVTSPFVDLQNIDLIPKVLLGDTGFEEVSAQMETYDLIFDCSTDMEMALMLDRMQLRAGIINLSVTDEAKDLVCVHGRSNITEQKRYLFSKLNPGNKVPDFYPGTGCQYPTFRASYTDINSVLGYGIQYINKRLTAGKDLNTFVVSQAEDQGNFRLVINEY